MSLFNLPKQLIVLALSFISLISTNSLAQEFNENTCGTDKAIKELYKLNPQAKTELQQLRKQINSNQFRKMNKAKSYVVPVVFHVFGKTYNGGTTVTLDIIKEALKLTNQDFQGLNADYTTIDAPFDAIKQPLDITFKLAQLDPNGNPTTGVVFYNEASGMANYNSPEVKRVAWDNYKYCNIYITRDLEGDGDFYKSGVAWYPSKSMSDQNIARIVYNGSYLGKNTNENFRSVLTHEFGHYLDLPHTFDKGICNNNPNDGDGVADTPSQKKNSSGTRCRVIKNCLNQEINNENFMDYTDCYKMFTKGQVDRMVNALENSVARNTLWTEENLIATGLATAQNARVVASSTTFEERFLNDGIIEKTIDITCEDCTFSKSSGEFAIGIDYIIDNLPTGLTSKIEATSNTKATITLRGTATNHEAINSTENLIVNFLNNMITGGVDQLFNKKLKFTVAFKDEYTEYCNVNIRYATYGHITKVDFNGTINETAYEGTTDNTSKIKFVTQKGKTYPLSITTNKGKGGDGDNFRIQIWFDWNKNFIYEDNELVESHTYANSQANAQGNYTHNTNITIPNSINIDETAFRVLVHYVQREEGDSACSTIDSGESEDYGISITDDNTPFSVEFYGTPTIVNFSDKVNFADNSTAGGSNTITSWKWTFQGGTPSSSNKRNPQGILFKEAGKYDVTLEVTNSKGETKTLTKPQYITSQLKYCDSSPEFGSYFSVNNVKLATINHKPRTSVYDNYFNSVSTELKAGDTYPITIKAEKGNGGNGDLNRVRVWADWNYDSQFTSNELLVSKEVKVSDYNANGEYEFTENITVPNSAVIGKKLGLRVTGHLVKNDAGENACGKYESGNTADYGLIISNDIDDTPSKINSISNVTGVEGNNFQHTVVLSTASSQSVSFPMRINGISADSNVDFQAPTFSNNVTFDGTNITIPSGISRFTITIPTIDDDIVEDNETYKITSGSISGTGTITDNDKDTNPDGDYCPASTLRDDSYITKVTFGNVNNTSDFKAYSNYTNQFDTFKSGDTFSIAIETKNETWDSNVIVVWIDWNNNKRFEAQEQVYKKSGIGPYNTNITVPNNAITATPLRMRIRKAYGKSDISACGEDSGIGEVEDYSIMVSDNTASISDAIYNNKVVVYPIPTKENIFLITPSNKSLDLQVVNMEGKLIYTTAKTPIQHKVELNLPQLPNGMYFIKGKQENNFLFKKIIIVK
ncbi:T9SS type A sorting domain-containing protein [Tenacibaculum sp. 190524A02b]|uniref:T9SS type A sorting domain-containing protein n=1 Tax=Tenacibaculum vairaonense TaxID=3137860 RepID=A0ABM9PHX0_9FLAO